MPALTARMRLTAIFLALFVVVGAAVLALTYRLVDRQLPVISAVTVTELPGLPPAGAVPVVVGSGPLATSGPVPVTGGPVDPVLPGATGAPGAPMATVAPGQVPAELQEAAIRALESYRVATLNELLRNSALTLALGTLVAGGLMYAAAGRVLRPLHRITDTARRFGSGTLTDRVHLQGPHDELRDLADTVDSMLDRIEESFAAERRLVATTSHELRTPIANQRTLLEVALADPDASAHDLNEVCRRALTQVRRHEALVEAMLGLASAAHVAPVLVPVRLDELVDRLLAEQDCGDVAVEADVRPVTVLADELLAEVAVRNLLANAITHNVAGAQGRWLRIAVSHGTAGAVGDAGAVGGARAARGAGAAAAAGTVRAEDAAGIAGAVGAAGATLVVENSSAAMDAAALAAAREPFRRGGAARTGSSRGAGLGLSIVDTIAARHGWALGLSTPTPESFRASLTFPAPPR